MKNIDRIKNMSTKELAELLIEYNEDYDAFITSDCESFYGYDEEETYNKALEHEIEWLNSEESDE